ncbi:SDR family NAD(P)-dependent oxidoreductase [Xanthobacter flavus]|uniref:SDR family NAD(P)-dependent oxidoreductase n=1 Tax=Xanthobacter flavus TaxID=281 RepID=UPI00372CC40A
MAHDFKDRVIWITGAGGALGRASAETLAAQGATVIASGRRAETLPSAERIVPLAVDITDAAAVDAAAAEIVKRFGRLDGVVTSTNLPIFGDFLKLADADWLKVIDTKLLGTVRVVRAALPHLIASGKGSVVVLSGRGGIEPSPQHLPGSSVNAALILLVRGLGTVYGPQGVRVNAVSPGPIKSPRLDALNAAGTGAPPDTALPGPGLPTDVADAVAFLLSDEARYITGSNLFVDGGGRALA